MESSQESFPYQFNSQQEGQTQNESAIFERSSSWIDGRAPGTPQTPKTPFKKDFNQSLIHEVVPPPPEELDIRTLFTTNQLSESRAVQKVLFFDEFLVFLEQNQLYFCYYDHYQDIICIHDELIIDICIMNIRYNQFLILKENGDISVLFVTINGGDQGSTVGNHLQPIIEPINHAEEVSEMGESSFPIIQNLSSSFAMKNFLFPTILQENLNVNITQFGFIINPQLIFTSSNPIFHLQYFSNSSIILISNQIKTTIIQLKVNDNNDDDNLEGFDHEDQHGNNPERILPPSIIVDRSFDIEDYYLSHSIISSIWISKSYYHILSCNNDCILNVTILPKDPDEALKNVQRWKRDNSHLIMDASTFREMREKKKQKKQNQNNQSAESANIEVSTSSILSPLENDDKRGFRRSKSRSRSFAGGLNNSAAEIKSAEDLEEEEEERNYLFHQFKLKTRHKSWISSLSSCSHPECEYGISGDIDGNVILWIFEENNYDFHPNYLDELLIRQEFSAYELPHEKTKSKPTWKMLWHDKSLAEGHPISSMKLEVYHPSYVASSSMQEKSAVVSSSHGESPDHSVMHKYHRSSYQYYAYIGTSYGKVVILQLFAKSYHLLHELYLFSSIGEIHSFHVQFIEKEKFPESYQHSSFLSSHRQHSSAGDRDTFSPSASFNRKESGVNHSNAAFEIQQRLRIFSKQSGEAIECLLHKNISTIMKLLPGYSTDNHDLDLSFDQLVQEAKEVTSANQIADVPRHQQQGEYPPPQTSETINQTGQLTYPGGIDVEPGTIDIAASLTNLQTLKKPIGFDQFSRFHQHQRDVSRFFSSTLKTFTVLLDKNLIITTDWIQYLYVYDLMNGQLLHTIELKSTHCVQLLSFEFSNLYHSRDELDGREEEKKGETAFVREDEENERINGIHPRDRTLLVSGHQDGSIHLYELIIVPEEEEEEDDGDEDDNDEDDALSVGSEHSLGTKRNKKKAAAPYPMLSSNPVVLGNKEVFDLLEDSNLIERRYSLQKETDQIDLSFFATEGGESLFNSIESRPYQTNKKRKKLSNNQNQEMDGMNSKHTNTAGKSSKDHPLNKQLPMASNNQDNLVIESRLLLTIPFVNCPLKVTNFFFSNRGHYFCSIHLSKFLFLYSTNPAKHNPPPPATTMPPADGMMGRTGYQPNESLSTISSFPAPLPPDTMPIGTAGTAKTTSRRASTASRREAIPTELTSYNPKETKKSIRSDDPANPLIIPLKSFVFEEGLQKVTLLQPLSMNEAESQRPLNISTSSEDEKFMLILQYAHKIQLFNVLTCEVIGNIALNGTSVETITLKGSYLWYYPAPQRSDNNGHNSNETRLIGLSIHDLNSIYSFSYGKGFEQLISKAPFQNGLGGLAFHDPAAVPLGSRPGTSQGFLPKNMSSSTSWEYFPTGSSSFQEETSPLLSIWSMKKCTLCRVQFQPRNDFIHIMRMKNFETSSLKSIQQNGFNEIIGAQALKMVPWIRNHRAVIVLSNGYAVVIRF